MNLGLYLLFNIQHLSEVSRPDLCDHQLNLSPSAQLSKGKDILKSANVPVTVWK